MFIAAFDTETTGLIDNHTVKLDKQPEIIEIYACIFNDRDGKIKHEFNTFIKPKVPITQEITKITGISNAMVKDAAAYSFHSKQINSMLNDAPVLTGHNLSFDTEMVAIENERCGLPPLKLNRQICTVEQTLHLKGFRLSLSNLHEYLFGEPFEGAHRAKVDVHAQIRCYMELKKREEL